MTDYPLPGQPDDPAALAADLVAAHTAWMGVDPGSILIVDGLLRIPEWLDADPETVATVIRAHC